VPLRDIWPELKRAQVGAYLLSMANPRHAYEVRLLRELAFDDDVRVVPGVIDTTTNYIEHPETVADRIERAVEQFGDPTRVLAGTDCGFESSAGTLAVVPDIAWQKLRSLSGGAQIASHRLFG
jgi:5-methyltetrahydropteroyltriglutamate--homocysteine methyltransferase